MLLDTTLGPANVPVLLRDAGVDVVVLNPDRSTELIDEQIRAIAEAAGVPETGSASHRTPSTSAISTEANAEEPQRDSSFLRYISTKLGGAALSLLMVVTLGFFLFILPGDPVAAIARERQMTPRTGAAAAWARQGPLGEQFIGSSSMLA